MARISFCLALVLLSGCPTAPPGSPDQAPTSENMGADPTVIAGPGEARAGVVRSGDSGATALFGGVNAEGAPGDIKLYNDRVQFVIGAARRSHGMVDVGGNIIDADLVRTNNTLGRDTLEDLYSAFALSRLLHAERVEIVNDGLDGNAAVVLATGTDVTWDYMTGLFELPEPALGILNLEVETTFRLEPDSWVVTVDTEMRNAGNEEITVSPRDGMMSSGEDLWTWAPDRGLLGPVTGELEAFGVSGHRGEATLSIWPSSGTFSNAGLGALAGDLGISTLTHPEVVISPGATHTLSRVFAVTPDILTAEGARWGHQGIPLAPVSGQVLEEGTEEGIPGVRVWFTEDGDDGRIAGFAMTDQEGSFRADLPVGSWSAWPVARSYPEAVQLPPAAGRFGPFAGIHPRARQLEALGGDSEATPLPFASGRATTEPTTFVLVNEADLLLTLPQASGARISIQDAGGQPLPAVLDVQWRDQPAPSVLSEPLKEAFGVVTGSRASWGWTADGTLDIALVPGTYTVRAGHGWRHGQSDAVEVVVQTGVVTDVQITLPEQLPRDGWLSVDPHLHAAPSFDGTLSMEHRLVTCAATGLDIPVMTDHDRQVDYTDLANAMGLAPRLTVLPGVEVTTVVRGHFNLFPIQADPTQINGGAEPWWVTPTNTQDLFDRMRQRAGAQALTQVNHPRTPGMFSVSQFDPTTGEPRTAQNWSWDFELFELLNAGVVDLAAVRADWFGMLNAGRVRVPMGSSDSHYSYIPCGWARTDVFLNTDSPEGVTPDAVREALLAGHVVVAGGTTLRATLDMGLGDVLPGDRTTGNDGALTITVRTPDWMAPGTLRVYRNGEIVYEEALDEHVDGLWFDGDIAVEAPSEAWFAVEVEGDQPVDQLWRGFVPYAITNAFRVNTPD